MPTLLIKNSLRHLTTHLVQTWLCVMGIMLGVSIIVAVDLANSSAQKAFTLSLNTLTGNASHQLTAGPQAINEGLYAKLRRELGLKNTRASVSDQVSVAGHTLTLLGIDAITESSQPLQGFQMTTDTSSLLEFILSPNTAILSERTARMLNVVSGQSLTLNHRSKLHKIKVVGIFTSDNPAASVGLIFSDIASAQEILGRIGRLDNINLTLSPRQQADLETWLTKQDQPQLKLISSQQKNDALKKMSRAFHTNLTAMSLLAVLVGALLIYNCMTFSVLQRRRTLGNFRNLGVSKTEIFSLIMFEALCLGALGTLGGLLLGIIMGQGLLKLVLQTVNDLYFILHVSEYFISSWSLIKGAAVGLLVTALAASIPAWEATHTRPIGVIQRTLLEKNVRSNLPTLFLIGLAFMGLGLLLAKYPNANLWLGFFSLSLLVLGFTLCVPQTVLWLISRLLLLAPFFSNMTRLTLRGITAGISRTGLAIAALALAIAVTIGVGIMVESFRATVASWLDQTLSGDIYVSTAGRSSGRNNSGLPSSLISNIQQLPGIAAINTSRMLKVETQFGLIRLMAITSAHEPKGLNIKHSVTDFRQQFKQGKGILISEPMAYHQKIQLNDTIKIQTPSGEQTFAVLGIFYDYTSSQGLMAMHGNLYEKNWLDPQISVLSIYRKHNTDQDTLLKAIRELASQQPMAIVVRSSVEIRLASLKIFDRTFTITQVLRLLAIVVAFMGILSALMALQMERKKEFATLRAMGMTQGQLSLMIIAQSMLMGLLAGLLAIPLGVLMSNILIEVINVRSFGWSMQQTYPFFVIWQALLISTTAAGLAGIYPAFKSANAATAQALREE